MKPKRVEVKRRIDSTIRKFIGTALERRIKTSLKNNFASLLEISTLGADKGETAVYRALENVVFYEMNELMHMMIDGLAESQNFVRHLAYNLS